MQCETMIDSARQSIINEMKSESTQPGSMGKALRDFFTHLAVCHTAMLEKPENDGNDGNEILGDQGSPL